MPKILVRIVSFLLAGCLIANPATATALSQQQTVLSPNRHISNYSNMKCFNGQALMLGLAFITNPLDIPGRLRAIRARRLEQKLGHERFASVQFALQKVAAVARRYADAKGAADWMESVIVNAGTILEANPVWVDMAKPSDSMTSGLNEAPFSMTLMAMSVKAADVMTQAVMAIREAGIPIPILCWFTGDFFWDAAAGDPYRGILKDNGAIVSDQPYHPESINLPDIMVSVADTTTHDRHLVQRDNRTINLPITPLERPTTITAIQELVRLIQDQFSRLSNKVSEEERTQLYSELEPIVAASFSRFSTSSMAKVREFISVADAPHCRYCQTVAEQLKEDLIADGWESWIQGYHAATNDYSLDHHFVVVVRWRGRLWMVDPTWQQTLPAQRWNENLPPFLLLSEMDVLDDKVFASMGISESFWPIWHFLMSAALSTAHRAVSPGHSESLSSDISNPQHDPRVAYAASISVASPDEYGEIADALEDLAKKDRSRFGDVADDDALFRQHYFTAEMLDRVALLLDPPADRRDKLSPVLVAFIARDPISNQIAGARVLLEPRMIVSDKPSMVSGVDAVPIDRQRAGIGRLLRVAASQWLMANGYTHYAAEFAVTNEVSERHFAKVMEELGAKRSDRFMLGESSIWQIFEFPKRESPATPDARATASSGQEAAVPAGSHVEKLTAPVVPSDGAGKILSVAIVGMCIGLLAFGMLTPPAWSQVTGSGDPAPLQIVQKTTLPLSFWSTSIIYAIWMTANYVYEKWGDRLPGGHAINRIVAPWREFKSYQDFARAYPRLTQSAWMLRYAASLLPVIFAAVLMYVDTMPKAAAIMFPFFIERFYAAANLFFLSGLLFLSGLTQLMMAGQFIRTKPNASLLTRGVFGRIRHPLYLSYILVTFAWLGIYRLDVGFTAFLPIPLLTWTAWSILEDYQLWNVYGDKYARYALRTPRFIPRFSRRITSATMLIVGLIFSSTGSNSRYLFLSEHAA